MWNRYVWWVVVALVGFLTATAVMPIFPVNWWWVRFGDFPRLQLLIVYMITASTLFLFRRRRGVWIAGALLFASCVIQLYWIYDYLPIATRQVETAREIHAETTLRVMSTNVLQSNTNADGLLRLIESKDPDLLVLCEVNDRWISDLASLKEKFAFYLTHPLENRYGIAMYSKLKVPRAEVRMLVKEGVPSIDAEIILRCGHTVHVFAVHPNPPRFGEDTTMRDAELVLVGREVQDVPSAIVLGDLNDVGWSRTSDLFQEVSNLLDPRVGRGFYSTFDATSWIIRYPLDYLFHSDDFRVVELEVMPAFGSDHFPLWIVLNHEPVAEDTQAAPELDVGDQKDASQAIDAADKDDSTKAIDR